MAAFTTPSGHRVAASFGTDDFVVLMFAISQCILHVLLIGPETKIKHKNETLAFSYIYLRENWNRTAVFT